MRFLSYFLAICLSSACSSENDTYNDLNFRTAEVSEACDYDGVPKDSYAYELQQTQCERAKVLDAHRQSQENYRMQSQALFSGQCDLFFELFGMPLEEIEGNWPDLAGGMHQRGLCTSQSSEKAFEGLRAAVEGGLNDPATVAQLGALYWSGEGAPLDQARARELFRLAALYAFPDYFNEQSLQYERSGSWAYRLGLDDRNAFWGVSKVQSRVAFMPQLLGPWDLPPPLKEERLWMERVYMSGPGGIVEIAEQLWRGQGGYPQLPNLALRWLVVADLAGAPNADYTIAKLHLDVDTGRLLVGSRHYDYRIAKPGRTVEQNLKCYGQLEMGFSANNAYTPALLWFLKEIVQEIKARTLIDFQAFSSPVQADAGALVAHVRNTGRREELYDLINAHDRIVYLLYVSGIDIPAVSRPGLQRIVGDVSETRGVSETFFRPEAINKKFCGVD